MLLDQTILYYDENRDMVIERRLEDSEVTRM